MAKDKIVDRNHPKSLTSEQRLYLDQLVLRFKDDITMVKRADLKQATKDILKIQAAPDWITRNLKCRCAHKRGRYDLSVLVKLPVVAFAETTKKTKKVTKKVVKETAPNVVKVPRLKKVPVIKTVDVPPVADDLDGIPLLPPTE